MNQEKEGRKNSSKVVLRTLSLDSLVRCLCIDQIMSCNRSKTKKGNAATDVLGVEKMRVEESKDLRERTAQLGQQVIQLGGAAHEDLISATGGVGGGDGGAGGGAVVTEERDEWGRLKNLTLRTLGLVFIPDLLIPITEFLGDDDVAIRFVGKLPYTNLLSETSRVTVPAQDDNRRQDERCSHEMAKKRPYVTSVSKAEWAINALKMPITDSTFLAAVAGGIVGVVKLMRNHADARITWSASVCSRAAENGHLDVLQWARAQDPPCPWNADVSSGAARNGRLDVLQWARAQDPPCPWDASVSSGAAQFGHLHVLQWARAQNPPCPWGGALFCICAASGGHLDVLQWARAQDPPCPWDEWVCRGAAMNGHLHVLQWARAQDPPCPWNEDVCTNAARNGRLHVLQWARAQDPPRPWDARVCTDAAANGHLDVLQWARAQDPPCPWDADVCIRAATKGHLDVLQWARTQGAPE